MLTCMHLVSALMCPASALALIQLRHRWLSPQPNRVQPKATLRVGYKSKCESNERNIECFVEDSLQQEAYIYFVPLREPAAAWPLQPAVWPQVQLLFALHTKKSHDYVARAMKLRRLPIVYTAEGLERGGFGCTIFHKKF